MSIGLDELAIAPERAADLSDEDRRVLRYRIEAVRAALDLDMPAPSNGNGNGHRTADGDFTLDQAAAAKMLGVSVSYLEHHRELPIFVKQGRKVMVSNQALQNYIKTLRAQRR